MGFEIGDLVWAKMKSYPPWPAQISNPDSVKVKPPKNKIPHQFVYFFGSNNVAWIPEDKITPHSESVFDTLSKKKNKVYQEAIDALMNMAGSVGKHKLSPKKDSASLKRESTKKDSASVKRESIKKDSASLKRESTKKDSPSVKRESAKKDSASLKRESIENGSSSPKRKFTDIDLESPKKTEIVRKKFVKLVPSVSRKNVRKLLTHITPVKKIHKRKSSDGFVNGESSVDSLSKSNYHSLSNISVGNRFFESDDESLDEISATHEYVRPVIGFIGLNEVGGSIVKKFIKSEFEVWIWDSDILKADKFMDRKNKVNLAMFPKQLIVKCDITFCFCETDTDEFKDIIAGENGILNGFEEAERQNKQKGYVGLGIIDYKTSEEIHSKIAVKNGFYLEAPIGFRTAIIDDQMMILASGDKRLFNKCEKLFEVFSKNYVFVGTGNGTSSDMCSLLNTVHATVIAGMIEASTLLKDDLEIFKGFDTYEILNLMLKKDDLSSKVSRMNTESPVLNMLKYVQKNLDLALNSVSPFGYTPISTAVNESFKHAKLLDYAENDITAIFKSIKK